ncbi:hypothetical protein NL676_038741 [Syzygium grande]|nr:hypothetical protein NL676_038741 [Syzygium grande]
MPRLLHLKDFGLFICRVPASAPGSGARFGSEPALRLEHEEVRSGRNGLEFARRARRMSVWMFSDARKFGRYGAKDTVSTTFLSDPSNRRD